MAILQILLALYFLPKGFRGVHVSFMAVNKFKTRIISLHFVLLMSAANNNPFHLLSSKGIWPFMHKAAQLHGLLLLLKILS